jgi:uncharacterized protein (UPF0332 family)
MRRIRFLAELKGEGKLSLVEPSEDISESYRKKCESNLISSRILLENNRLEEAIALTYFSMYHLLTALLFKAGIKCENHAACIILLKELFGMDNKPISSAKEERIDKQYHSDFEISPREVRNAIQGAESFNALLLEFISRITTQQVDSFRSMFELIT